MPPPWPKKARMTSVRATLRSGEGPMLKVDPGAHANDGESLSRTRDHLPQGRSGDQAPRNHSDPCSDASRASRPKKAPPTHAVHHPLSPIDPPAIEAPA
jgi:hypothetical protein